MARTRLLISLGAVALSLAAAGPASAADHDVALTAEAPSGEWEGAAIPSIDFTYTSEVGGPCEAVPGHYCESALIHIDLPEGQKADLTVGVAGSPEDFDVFVYTSDAEGATGDFVDSSAETAPAAEEVKIAQAGGYYLVHVDYYQTLGDEGYKATASLSGLPEPEPTQEPTPVATPEPPPAPAPAPPPPPAQPAAEERPALPSDGFLATIAVPPRTPDRAAARGLGVRIGCNTGCQGVITARLTKRTARRLGLGRRSVRAGTAAFSITEAGSRTFLLKLSPRVRRALRRASEAAFEVTAEVTDDQGARARTLLSRPVLVG